MNKRYVRKGVVAAMSYFCLLAFLSGCSASQPSSDSPVAKKVKQILIAQFAVNANRVQDSTILVKDLGADNVDFAEILLAIEQEYGIKFSADESDRISKSKTITVGQLIQIVAEKTGSSK